jgi:hypothetical protein
MLIGVVRKRGINMPLKHWIYKWKKQIRYAFYYAIIIATFLVYRERRTIYLFSILDYEEVILKNSLVCFTIYNFVFINDSIISLT